MSGETILSRTELTANSYLGWLTLFQVDRKQQAVIIVVAVVMLFTAGYRVALWHGEQDSDPGKAGEVVQNSATGGGREIVVHVSGAVEKPGVYRFDSQMRVMDALERAIPLPRADVQSLNLAAPIKDGQKIVVPLAQENPRNGETAAPAGGSAQAAGADTPQKPAGARAPARVNINRAGPGELELLPGIGPGLAGRIISHRESKGLFVSEEEIKNVPGIGDKLYDQIKDLITVQ